MPRGTPSEGPVRWGLGDAALGVAVGYFLSSLLASVWLGASGRKQLTLGGLALSQLGLWVGLAGSAVWAARAKGSGRLAVDFGFRARPSDLAVGLVVGLAAQLVLVNAVALLLSPLVGHPETSGPVKDLVDKAHGPGLWGLALFAVVGAPVVEELFFRGLLLRSLRRRLSEGWAVAVSAVLFGVAHVQALPAGALAVVVTSLIALGAVLAVLALRSGRLGPGIAAHAVFNAFTVVLLLTGWG